MEETAKPKPNIVKTQKLTLEVIIFDNKAFDITGHTDDFSVTELIGTLTIYLSTLKTQLNGRL